MPLLLLTGPPSSGKTTVAKRVVDALKARDVHPILISDTLNSEFDRSADFYLDKRKNVDHTSLLRSEVMRLLTKNSKDFVIVDSLNYARSQRYELFTIAQNNRTTFCILFCDAENSVSDWLNEQRDDGYKADVLEDLRSRFERPKPHLKGDKPTYELNIGKEDDTGNTQTPRNIELPIDEIYESLVKGKALQQNKSTTPFKFR